MRNILLAAVATLAFAATAQAQTNGSFETGNFSGWTQIGNTGFTGVETGGTDGSFEAYFGPVGSLGGITQNLATISGHNYTISFDLANSGGSPNNFEASFGATTGFSYVDAGGFGYQSLSFNALATGSSTALTFLFRQDPSYYYLDKVSVTDNGGAVPEPATWAMMLGGFGLVGGALRSRRNASVSFG